MVRFVKEVLVCAVARWDGLGADPYLLHPTAVTAKANSIARMISFFIVLLLMREGSRRFACLPGTAPIVREQTFLSSRRVFTPLLTETGGDAVLVPIRPTLNRQPVFRM